MLVYALARYPTKGEWMAWLVIHLLKLVIGFSRVHASLCTHTRYLTNKEWIMRLVIHLLELVINSTDQFMDKIWE